MPNSQNYDQNLKIVATFDTIQSFWSVYTHLVRPNDLTGHSDLHVFKSGIKPLWEVSLFVYKFYSVVFQISYNFYDEYLG